MSEAYYPKNGKVILHVDMNCFYASVEMAHNVQLKGKPLAIAGNPKERKGIVVTCSYEARARGIKATMPLWEAKKLCSDLHVLTPNFPRYKQASEAMFTILRQYSTIMEPVSIDEGYVDITRCSHLGSPLVIANKIQRQIMQELDLPCSIGIAPNKFLAKMASDMKKPMGITVLRKRDIQSVIWPLPIIAMHGIGSKTAQKLTTHHIHTIADLASTEDYVLTQLLGVRGRQLKEKANGIDGRVVNPEASETHKSIGKSTTLSTDTNKQPVLLTVLKQLSDEVASRLYVNEYVATNITVTIRFHNRQTITRSRKLAKAISRKEEIYESAMQLFLDHWNGKAVRLLGVTAHELIDKQHAVDQLDLFSFEKEAANEPLYLAMEKLKERFGEQAIQKGIRRKRKPF